MSVINIKNLTKVYPTGKKANDNITIYVDEGETVGIIGPNGAGKTTLMRQLLGLLKPTAGRIEVMGINVAEKPKEVKNIVGYVPQYPLYYPSLKVEEVLYYILRMRGVRDKGGIMEGITSVLELVGLEAARNAYGYQLSGGMMKSLLLAMALIREPPLLILDEPTSMVDIVTKERIWNVLQNADKRGILLASHDISEVKRLCDRIYILLEGRIIAHGTPAEISKMLRMPTEVTLMPRDQNKVEDTFKHHRIAYTKRGGTYEIAFEKLEEAISTLHEILKVSDVQYLELNSPSFEKVVSALMRGGEQ